MRKLRWVSALLSFILVIGILPQISVQAADSVPDESGKGIEITESNFGVFYSTALHYDYDKNGWLSETEINRIQTLCIADKVKNLDGLEYFTAANTLFIADYAGKTLSIPETCKNITTLYVEPTVSSVKIDAPYITNLVVSPVDAKINADGTITSLTSRLIGSTKGTVKKLDLSTCKSAVYIGISVENISSVTLPKTGNSLRVLDLYYLSIKTIDLSSCTKVQCLYVYGCEKLTKLSTSGMTALKAAYIHFCTKLTKFDFSKNTKLTAVGTDLNTTTTLPKGKKVTSYIGTTATKVFSTSDTLRKKYSCCNFSNSATEYSIDYYVGHDEEYQTGKAVKISKTNFPSFYKILQSETYDYNQDGWLSEMEIANCRSLTITSAISDLTGIEKLTSLEKLVIAKYKGTTLTVNNASISYIVVEPYGKKLTVNAPYVKRLYIGMLSVSESGGTSNWHSGSTVTTSVNVSKCKAVNSLSVNLPTVSTLKLPTTGTNLAILELDELKIKSIDLSAYKNLQYLRCYFCENLSKLDLTKNTKLEGLWFCSTKIKTLNLSKQKVLEELDTYCSSNLKVTFASGASVNWSKTYNTGVYKIQERIQVRYSLID